MYIFKRNSRELNIRKVEFHLNFQKNISDKICVELDIVNVEFHM